MEKNQKKKVETKTEVVKRKDYKFLIDFFQTVKTLDLNLRENKEAVEAKYFEQSHNKVFSNIERVIKRSLRAEIKPTLERELSESNLTLQEYTTISYQIINLSKNKPSKLIEVEIKK
jgi:hypothetical protein